MQNNYNLNNRTGYANSKKDRLHDYAAAKVSEQSFAKWYKEHNRVKLKDVSGIREFQHKDIDFIAIAPDGTETAIEIKNDMTCFTGKCTHNLCFEITQRGKDGNGNEYSLPGWFERTQADKLFILSGIKGNNDEYICTELDREAVYELYLFRDDLFKTRYSGTGCENALIDYDDLIANLNPANYKKHGKIKIIK